jgi:Tfp pilus assembly protein PilX
MHADEADRLAQAVETAQRELDGARATLDASIAWKSWQRDSQDLRDAQRDIEAADRAVREAEEGLRKTRADYQAVAGSPYQSVAPKGATAQTPKDGQAVRKRKNTRPPKGKRKRYRP